LFSVVVALYHHQRFFDLFDFANKINNFKDINVVLYINEDVYTRFSEEINNCSLKKIFDPNIISKKNKPISINKKNSIFNFLIKKLSVNLINQQLRNTSIFQVLQEKKYYSYLKAKYFFILEAFNENKVDVVFVTGDRHLHEEPAILKAAKDSGALIILPYLVNYADHERIIKGRSENLVSINSFYSWYTKNKKLSNNSYKNYNFYPFYALNALNKFGTLSVNPWVMGSGLSDLLCLNSSQTFKYYEDFGVQKKKLNLVGDISYDDIHKKYINQNKITEFVFKKYNLNPNRKLIMISLPQLAEHQIMSWDDHWCEIDFLISSLVKTKNNILISLHPKMNPDDYKFLEKKFNCSIISERLKDVLPASDIFLATYSSTIVWAILCGIKTIIFDFYDLKYAFYDYLQSITFVDNKLIFLESIEELIAKDVDFKKDWDILSRSEVFDGNVISRYVKTIYDCNNFRSQ